MTRGRLIVISAPSGTGKTSVIQHLLKRHPEMVHSVSWSTRKKRPQEVDGKDYHFVDETAFRRGIAEQNFAEWAQVHHAYYGTPKQPLEQWLREGRDVVLDLDVQGAKNLKRLYPDRTTTVFLLPPSEVELEQRLSKRQTDTERERQIRLQNAKQEMMQKNLFDFQVVNEDLDQACLQIETILKS